MPAIKQSKSVCDNAQMLVFAPTVTVGIPVFNGADHLEHTVECLLAQDYSNLEILISDNNSNDQTGEIGRKLESKYKQVKYSRNEQNIGSLSNFDRLFALCASKYFLWSGHHDELSPGFISKAVEIMERDDSVVNCVSRKAFVSRDGSPYEHPYALLDTRGLSKSARFLSTAWHLQTCSEFYGIYRVEALKKLMPIKRILCLDVIMLVELAALGSAALIADERLTMEIRPYDILSTCRRHGFAVNSITAIKQYLLLCAALIGATFRNFSLPVALGFILPSLLFCLIEKYVWVYQHLAKALKNERQQNVGGTNIA